MFHNLREKEKEKDANFRDILCGNPNYQLGSLIAKTSLKFHDPGKNNDMLKETC